MKFKKRIKHASMLFGVLLSKMFPNKIRSVAMSVAVAAPWAANYAVSQSFPIVMDSEVNNGAT
jgi:SP family xylose:H+ symportor-like MFS transporter